MSSLCGKQREQPQSTDNKISENATDSLIQFISLSVTIHKILFYVCYVKGTIPETGETIIKKNAGILSTI